MANRNEAMARLMNSGLKLESSNIVNLSPDNDLVTWFYFLYKAAEIVIQKGVKTFFKSVQMIILVILMTHTGTVAIGYTSDISNNWEEIYNHDGITGYERSILGEAIKEFKATAYINAGIEVISEVLKDIPSYPFWMAMCGEAKLLEKINKDKCSDG